MEGCKSFYINAPGLSLRYVKLVTKNSHQVQAKPLLTTPLNGNHFENKRSNTWFNIPYKVVDPCILYLLFSGDRCGVRDCVWRATVSTNRHVFISYIISEQYYDGYGHKWIRQNTITIRTFWFHTVTFVGYSSYLVTIFPVGTQH